MFGLWLSKYLNKNVHIYLPSYIPTRMWWNQTLGGFVIATMLNRKKEMKKKTYQFLDIYSPSTYLRR